MVSEVLEFLRPEAGTVIDATVGGGGHARAILEAVAERGGRGFVLGLDVDPDAVAAASKELAGYRNCAVVQSSYVDMGSVVERLGLGPVTGVLFDFGASLYQLQEPRRGFSHRHDGPLDMRFDQTGKRRSARELVRRVSELELKRLLRQYGEEPMSGRIARVVHEAAGRIETTQDLVEVVRRVLPGRFVSRALPRVFQALRIAVNDELETIRMGLAAALEVLVSGGRLVTICYHSLEARLVKQAFGSARGRLAVLTRKAVPPKPDEVRRNPRARSARLRAARVVA